LKCELHINSFTYSNKTNYMVLLTSQSYGVVSSVCASYIVQCTSRRWYSYSHT